jgi:hypothetical protein
VVVVDSKCQPDLDDTSMDGWMDGWMCQLSLACGDDFRTAAIVGPYAMHCSDQDQDQSEHTYVSIYI